MWALFRFGAVVVGGAVETPRLVCPYITRIRSNMVPATPPKLKGEGSHSNKRWSLRRSPTGGMVFALDSLEE